jgi:hypothetical protein
MGWRAAGGYGSGQGWILPILNDVAATRSGIGVMGVVDDGCDCFMTIDGGYEIVDFESKRSDDISMSTIVVIMNNNDEVRLNECVYMWVKDGVFKRGSLGIVEFELKYWVEGWRRKEKQNKTLKIGIWIGVGNLKNIKKIMETYKKKCVQFQSQDCGIMYHWRGFRIWAVPRWFKNHQL